MIHGGRPFDLGSNSIWSGRLVASLSGHQQIRKVPDGPLDHMKLSARPGSEEMLPQGGRSDGERTADTASR